jgi:hypothetical protein
MSTFNNWLHARLNESGDAVQNGDSNERSYIPMLEKKVEQMKNFYKDIGTGVATGHYNMLTTEIGEIMTKIENKWKSIEGMIQALKNNNNVG